MAESAIPLSQVHAEYAAARSAYSESKAALGVLLGDLVGKRVAICGFPTEVTREIAASIKFPTPFRCTYPLGRSFAQPPKEPVLFQLDNNEVLKVAPEGLTIAANETGEGLRNNNVISYHFPLDSVVSLAEVPVVES